MVIHRSKFKSGAKSISTSLQSISPTELLQLLDSRDHVGSVTAQADSETVFSEEQLQQLLDRSDLAWGDNQVDVKKDSVNAVKGVFQVLDKDLQRNELGSIKDK